MLHFLIAGIQETGKNRAKSAEIDTFFSQKRRKSSPFTCQKAPKSAKTSKLTGPLPMRAGCF
jgi:hypothetical protein